MLARKRPEREQAFLHAVQPPRIGLKFADASIDGGAGLRRLGRRAVERFERVVEHCAGDVGPPRQHPVGPGEARLRALVAGHLGQGLGKRVAEAFGMAQPMAGGRQRFLFAFPRAERVELFQRVAQRFLFPGSGPGFGERIGERRLGGTPGVPGGGYPATLLLQPSIPIEYRAMVRPFGKIVTGELTDDLDQRFADRPE